MSKEQKHFVPGAHCAKVAKQLLQKFPKHCHLIASEQTRTSRKLSEKPWMK